MSQLKFSQLIGVPVSTVKAIENNQRSLSRSVRERARLATGAGWDESSGQFLYYPEETAFKEYRQKIGTRPPDDERDVDRLTGDIHELFEKVPDAYWHRYFFRLEDFVNECLVEIDKLPGARRKPTRQRSKRPIFS
jgi:transcriptional regulator with XRE-family HTH domain